MTSRYLDNPTRSLDEVLRERTAITADEPDAFAAGVWSGQTADGDAPNCAGLVPIYALPPERPSSDAASDMLTLFREWLALGRKADELAAVKADPCEKEYDRRLDIERMIGEMPVRGPADLAIKTYLLAFEICQDTDEIGLELQGMELQGSYYRIGRLLRDGTNYAVPFNRATDSYSEPARLFLPQLALRSVLDGAADILPELRPLVAGITEAPIKLPEPDGFEPFHPKQLALNCAYAIRAVGDAMAPRFYDGEIMHVSTTQTVEAGEHGDDVVLRLKDGSATLVRLLAKNDEAIICRRFGRSGTSEHDLADVVSIDRIAYRVAFGPYAEPKTSTP